MLIKDVLATSNQKPKLISTSPEPGTFGSCFASEVTTLGHLTRKQKLDVVSIIMF